MKKTIFLMSLVATLALSSCTGESTSTEATEVKDSTAVTADSTTVGTDSTEVKVDSAK